MMQHSQYNEPFVPQQAPKILLISEGGTIQWVFKVNSDIALDHIRSIIAEARDCSPNELHRIVFASNSDFSHTLGFGNTTFDSSGCTDIGFGAYHQANPITDEKLAQLTGSIRRLMGILPWQPNWQIPADLKVIVLYARIEATTPALEEAVLLMEVPHPTSTPPGSPSAETEQPEPEQPAPEHLNTVPKRRRL